MGVEAGVSNSWLAAAGRHTDSPVDVQRRDEGGCARDVVHVVKLLVADIQRNHQSGLAVQWAKVVKDLAAVRERTTVCVLC